MNNDADLQKKFLTALRFILSSNIRINILFSLYDRNKDINDLKKELKKRPENILREIKKLNQKGFVEKKDKTYYLSSTGVLIVLQSINFVISTHLQHYIVNFGMII